jgi:hypothetical protein
MAEMDHLTTKRRSQDLARQAILDPDNNDRPKPLDPRPQLHGPPLCCPVPSDPSTRVWNPVSSAISGEPVMSRCWKASKVHVVSTAPVIRAESLRCSPINDDILLSCLICRAQHTPVHHERNQWPQGGSRASAPTGDFRQHQ